MLSVLTQAGDFSIQYLLTDGGSTDESVAIATRLKEQLQAGKLWCHCTHITIDIISEPDKGMYDAVAKGFERANGEVVAYLNADDIYLPGALQHVKTIFDLNNHIHWLCGRHLKIDENGKPIKSFLPFNYRPDMLRAGLHGTDLPYVQQENVFWRKALLNEIDLAVFRSYRLAGDFYLWYCFALHHRLHITNRHLAAFRTHGQQLSQVQRERYEQEFNLIRTHTRFSRLQVLAEQVKNYKFPDFIKVLLSPSIISNP